MAGRIAQADVEEVKARTNIADIISERVALKSAGVGSLKGLCPFHDERSPSFHVRPQMGFYHCFGCGESGDVYTFLQRMDHMSFAEAVERLAGRIGYTLHYEEGGVARETSGRARLYEANKDAAEFFRAQLMTGEAEVARRFLGARGFDAGAAAHFGVGYAPNGWNGLRDALRKKGYTDEELLAAGLLSQGQRGAYDRFRGRAIWPIRDVTGQVIGFGARKLLDDDPGPKYLNTPETPIYKKSQVLYGLDLARKPVSREHRVVVVEGYTDVMACHLAGVETAVATCGTAFGVEHIAVLRRVMGDDGTAGEVVFTFDPDAAGQKAALRAFADEKRFAAQTYVAVAPDGLDPCDLRLQRGDGAVRGLLTAKTPMFEFVIDQRLAGYDLATVEGQIGALRAAAPVVAEIRDPSLRPGYTRVLARRLGLELDEVQRAVNQLVRGSKGEARGGESGRGREGAVRGQRSWHPAEEARDRGAQDRAGVPESDPDQPATPAPRLATLPRTPEAAFERDAIMAFLQYGHHIDAQSLRAALDERLQHPGLDAVRSAIAAVPDHSRPGWAPLVVDAVREPYRLLAADLLAAEFPARDEAHAVASAKDLANRLRMRGLDREKRELVGTLRRVDPASEEGRRTAMRLREIDRLRQMLREDQ